MKTKANMNHFFCCQNFCDAVTKDTDSMYVKPVIKSEYPYPSESFFLGSIEQRIRCCPWCGWGLDDDDE